MTKPKGTEDDPIIVKFDCGECEACSTVAALEEENAQLQKQVNMLIGAYNRQGETIQNVCLWERECGHFAVCPSLEDPPGDCDCTMHTELVEILEGRPYICEPLHGVAGQRSGMTAAASMKLAEELIESGEDSLPVDPDSEPVI